MVKVNTSMLHEVNCTGVKKGMLSGIHKYSNVRNTKGNDHSKSTRIKNGS